MPLMPEFDNLTRKPGMLPQGISRTGLALTANAPGNEQSSNRPVALPTANSLGWKGLAQRVGLGSQSSLWNMLETGGVTRKTFYDKYKGQTGRQILSDLVWNSDIPSDYGVFVVDDAVSALAGFLIDGGPRGPKPRGYEGTLLDLSKVNESRLNPIRRVRSTARLYGGYTPNTYNVLNMLMASLENEYGKGEAISDGQDHINRAGR